MSYREKMQWCLDGHTYDRKIISNKSGPDEAPTWEVRITIQLTSVNRAPYIGIGIANSIKVAKENAAMQIYQQMVVDNLHIKKAII